MKEIEKLKGNKEALQRPGTASVEVGKLKEEKESLIMENQRLQKKI